MAKTRPPLLTNKKAAWVGQFKPTAVMRGETLAYNAALQSRYEAELLKLVGQMSGQVEKALAKFFKGEDAPDYFAEDASPPSQARILLNKLTRTFNALYAKRAPALAKSMVDAASKGSRSALHSSLRELSGGLSLKTGLVNENLDEALSAAVTENVNLIKSISQDYLGQVSGAVMRSLQPGGNGLADLVPFLQERKEITKRRARNIALDQTRKAFNDANAIRMQSLGVKKFEWIHSGGGAHPRKDHIEMSGNIYSFDDLPVIGVMYGVEVRGLPGQLPNCRCTMRPVIEFDEGEQQ
jgi:SPP1 gp7 family putative phage head morphogenesis protein